MWKIRKNFCQGSVLSHKEELEKSVEHFIYENNIQDAIDAFDEHMKKVHTSEKKRRIACEASELIDFDPVNDAFEKFITRLSHTKSSDAENQI